MTAVTELELAEAVIHAAKRIRKTVIRRLAPFGLTPSQGRALHVIARHAVGLRPNQLAESLHVVPRSATTLVDALEASGLVTRTPDPDDRRATLLRLTDAGSALVAESNRIRQEAAAEYFAALGPEDRTRMLALLQAAETVFLEKHPRHRHHHGHGHERPEDPGPH